MNKKLLLIIVLGLALAFCFAACGAQDEASETNTEEDTTEADAEEWVFDRGIEVIVPFGAGSGNDQTTRALMPLIADILGVNITVTNVEGGGGLVGMEHAASLPADGYTFFECSPTHIVLSLQDMSSVSILEDFTPVIKMVEDVVVICGNANLPYTNWEELQSYLAENPEGVSLGGMSGIGVDYIAAHMLMKAADVNFRYVTFDSGSEMTAAVLGGHLDTMTGDPGDAQEYVNSGDMIAYIALANDRLSILPDTPCTGELGYDVTFGPMRCIAAKKGTPQGAIDAFEAAAAQAVQSQEWQDYLEMNELNYKPGFCGSEELASIWDELAETLPAMIEE